jgi:hypothetical protein
MKHIKKFENFDLDSLGDPSKPIHREDLTGKPFESEDHDVPKIDVVYAVEFVPSTGFDAINNAREYLKDLGYTIGSMQGSYPIAFATGVNYISKWDGLSGSDIPRLDGVVIPIPSFRDGGNLVLFFKTPNL